MEPPQKGYALIGWFFCSYAISAGLWVISGACAVWGMCGENESFNLDAGGISRREVNCKQENQLIVRKNANCCSKTRSTVWRSQLRVEMGVIALPSPLGRSEYDERKRNEHKTPAIDDVQSTERINKMVASD